MKELRLLGRQLGVWGGRAGPVDRVACHVLQAYAQLLAGYAYIELTELSLG